MKAHALFALAAHLLHLSAAISIYEEDNPDQALVTTDHQQALTVPKAELHVEEKPHSFLVNVELPGVNKDDVKVQVKNGVLEVSAEKKMDKKVDRGRYHYSEHRYGAVKKAIKLPPQVDSQDVEKEFKDGVLTLTFPKKDDDKQITSA